MKRFIGILLIALLAFGMSAPVNSFAEENSTTLEGAKMIDGRTLLPLRSIFEALGANVEWSKKTNTVTAVRGQTTIVLPINSKVSKVNGVLKALDVPARIIDNNTMVPVRFVSEALGASVSWDQKNSWAIIKYQGQEIKVLSQSSQKSSYLRDTNYTYTYTTQVGQTVSDTFLGKVNDFNKWSRQVPKLEVGDTGFIYLYEKQDKSGLYAAYDESGSQYTELTYPVKEGTTWIDSISQSKYVISSINKTIKVKAGTFNKVLELVKYNYYDPTDKSSYYIEKMYYAPNKGLILHIQEDERVFELVKLTKR